MFEYAGPKNLHVHLMGRPEIPCVCGSAQDQLPGLLSPWWAKLITLLPNRGKKALPAQKEKLSVLDPGLGRGSGRGRNLHLVSSYHTVPGWEQPRPTEQRREARQLEGIPFEVLVRNSWQ